MSKEKSAISVFQKYLTVWVILCMVIGVLIGKFLLDGIDGEAYNISDDDDEG